MEAMKPVKIYSSGDRIEAQMLVEALKRQEIPAYCQGVGSGGYMDIYAGFSIYGEDIYVDEKDAEAAKQIIEEMTQEADGGEISMEEAARAGKSKAYAGRLLLTLLLVLAAVMIGFFFLND